MVGVLFDLDGTLIDSLPNITDAVNTVLQQRGLPALPRETVAGFVGRGVPVLVDRMIAATALEPIAREGILKDLMAAYDVEALKTQLFPGVHAALTALQADAIPLGVVTNKPRAPMGPTLEAAGIAHFFGVTVAGDDLPQRKPDPLPLTHAMEALGVSQAIFVGDSETDAATAANAAVPFVLFTEGIRLSPLSDLPHDAAFSDFGQLPDVLQPILTTFARTQS